MLKWLKNHKKMALACFTLVCLLAVLVAGAMQMPHSAHAASPNSVHGPNAVAPANGYSGVGSTGGYSSNTSATSGAGGSGGLLPGVGSLPIVGGLLSGL